MHVVHVKQTYAKNMWKIAVCEQAAWSAADHRHAAVGAFEAFVSDIVFQFLVPDGLAQCLRERFIGGTGAQNGAQIGFFGGEETGAKLPVGGQPDAVAGGAEWLADGVNEANLTYSVAEGVTARCFRGVACRDGDQRTVFRFDDGLDFPAGQDVFLAPYLVGIQWHKFDPAHDVGFTPRQAHKIQRLFFAITLDGDGIYLDWMNRWVLFKLFQPFQHAL